MSEEKHKSMMIKLTMKHTLDGFDRVTIGIDVAPFGYPSISYGDLVPASASILSPFSNEISGL